MRREGVTASLDQLEAVLNDQKLALLEIERELATAQGGLHDREEARTRAEHQVVLLRERAAGLTARAEEDDAESARMRERLAEVVTREAEAEASAPSCAWRATRAQVQAEACERVLGDLEAEARRGRNVASEHKQQSLDLFSTEAEKRGACERLEERQRLLGERRAGAEARIAEIAQRLALLAESGAGASAASRISSWRSRRRASCSRRLITTSRGCRANTR